MEALLKLFPILKTIITNLIVKNTGHLNGNFNPDGFGLYSTQNRLMLLYGEKAHFEIKNSSDNMVEAKYACQFI